jgi:hypothetical protein
MEDQGMFEKQTTRREVMKKAAYVAPAILTLAALPSFAAKGSGEEKKPKKSKEIKRRVRRKRGDD